MYTDIFGKRRAKLGLHIHTTLSDGRRSPEAAAQIFKDAGYDAIALTDHWIYGETRELSGLPVISGCEYNFGGGFAQDGVYHIVGIGTERDPLGGRADEFLKSVAGLSSAEQANRIIEKIREAGGFASVAHPAWSVNSPEQIKALNGLDATEIYNTVSDLGMSNRPYSGAVVDMLASENIAYGLLATDDTHYYDGDACVSYIMAETDDVSPVSVVEAVRSGRFYATQGPEVHLIREGESKFRVVSSPVEKIVFMSNRVWADGRVAAGHGITEAVYEIIPGESFIRAEVTDADGRRGWTNVIFV